MGEDDSDSISADENIRMIKKNYTVSKKHNNSLSSSISGARATTKGSRHTEKKSPPSSKRRYKKDSTRALFATSNRGACCDDDSDENGSLSRYKRDSDACTISSASSNESDASENGDIKQTPLQLSVDEEPKQFKLRIVPLEKLLEHPPEAVKTTREPTRYTESLATGQNKDKRQKLKQTPAPADAPRQTRANRDSGKNGTHQPAPSKLKIRKCVVRVKRCKLPTTSLEGIINGIESWQSISSTTRIRTNTMSSTSSSSKAVAGSVVGSDSAIFKASRSTSKIKAFVIDSDESNLDKDTPTNAAAATVIDSDSDTTVEHEDEAIAEQLRSDRDQESDGVKTSDSEVMPVRKKRRVATKQRRDSDSDFEPKEQAAKPSKAPVGRKRSRIQKPASGDSDSGSDTGEDGVKKKHKRKHIRKIIKAKDLDVSTKSAAKDEEDRRRRIEERQKLYNQIYEKPDSVEVTELVLDFDPETKKPLLQVDKGLLRKLKPHQVTGVKFMWDACFETLEDAIEKPGSGCILAHCMGLGKTLQIVTLSHTLITQSDRTGVERVLIISPLSTLNNWAREFRQWMSFARKKDIEVYDMSKYKDKPLRIFKLNEWFEEGGVCILGYDMYRILTNEKAKGLRKKQRETLQKALVDPGPDLVVCDEGHLLKNEKTSISKAVTRMRTLRRIVLTGTPLQNNLKEYYCMIQFIKPNLLGTYKEYLNRFVNPITNGQYTDSTDRDIRLMKHRSHILHKMLEGCIQRRDYSVLAPYLPPKHEYVVYTTLSDLQQMLYEHYMTTQRDMTSSDISGKGARLFQDFQDLRRIWTHPMNLRVNSDNVIRKRVLANDSDSMDDFVCDDDEEEASGSDTTSVSSKSFESGAGGESNKGVKRKMRSNTNANDLGGGLGSDTDDLGAPIVQDDPSEWWKRFFGDKELNNINHSPKLVILMRLLQECEAIGDKLLVFSQSLQSLDVIEHFLSLIHSVTKGEETEADVGNFKGVWTPGVDYFRLDGSCSVENREGMCKQFNNVANLRARLFLISTRAGGLGINLVAANRVVIFDVSWNPSHDTQSIFRVYRFGQDKPCYIYRLIAMGTMEQKVYERQVAKQATAKRVIDEQQISRHYNQSDLQELYSYELRPTVERELPLLPKDRLFAELLTEYEKLLFKYHEHDSLLENEESENLSESERKAAWAEFEAEKTRSVQTAQYISYDRNAFGNQFGNASGSVTSNKIFGFRSDVLLQLLNMKISADNPELSKNQIVQLVPSYLQQLYTEMNNCDPTMYKDLLALHATLEHPSGMYMNPLLFANQDSSAAGYHQTPAAPHVGAPGVVQYAVPQMHAPIGPQVHPLIGPQSHTVGPPGVNGFDPNHVYEID